MSSTNIQHQFDNVDEKDAMLGDTNLVNKKQANVFDQTTTRNGNCTSLQNIAHNTMKDDAVTSGHSSPRSSTTRHKRKVYIDTSTVNNVQDFIDILDTPNKCYSFIKTKYCLFTGEQQDNTPGNSIHHNFTNTSSIENDNDINTTNLSNSEYNSVYHHKQMEALLSKVLPHWVPIYTHMVSKGMSPAIHSFSKHRYRGDVIVILGSAKIKKICHRLGQHAIVDEIDSEMLHPLRCMLRSIPDNCVLCHRVDNDINANMNDETFSASLIPNVKLCVTYHRDDSDNEAPSDAMNSDNDTIKRPKIEFVFKTIESALDLSSSVLDMILTPFYSSD